MNNTKNDLCADVAKLDFEAMIFTANMAVGLLIESISRHLSEVREARVSEVRKDMEGKNNIRMYLRADDIRRDAVALSTCAATLATLNESRTREKLEVVNREPMRFVNL
jgi:DNA-binding transcriptional ArsR family regulator